MSTTLSQLFDLEEQICYVQCGYCSTILLVSVPNDSLTMVVTVRCGHCTSLLSVNMLKASFFPLHLFANNSLITTQDPELKQEVSPHEEAAAAEDADQKALDKRSPSPAISSDIDDEEDDFVPVNHIVHRPPEKRQRAPSAYNYFIKEEIRRLKNEYPNITHKEAFSAAAKNWAHFPPIQHKKDGETSCCGQGADQRKMPRSSNAGDQVGNNLTGARRSQ